MIDSKVGRLWRKGMSEEGYSSQGSQNTSRERVSQGGRGGGRYKPQGHVPSSTLFNFCFCELQLMPSDYGLISGLIY